MSDSSSSSSGGIGFVGLLTLLFIALKLLDKIDWSWWWVLSPLWISAALTLIFGIPALLLIWLHSRSVRGRLDAYARRTRGDRGIADSVLIVLGVLGMITVGIIIYIVVWATADTRGQVAAHNKIHGDADYRIAQYDHFFGLCAGVQTREAAIANAQEESKTASPARKEQLAAVITANRNERAELINTYNADASAAGTKGNFLASNLPYRLDLNSEETQCSA